MGLGGQTLEALTSQPPTGPGRHWMPSCPPIPLQTPWTSSRDSWCLPRTSGSAQPRPCSTPTCRGSGWGWRWAAKLGGALPRQPGPAAPAPAWLAPCRFHCPAREWTLGGAVRLPVQEGAQLSAAEYRRRLYKVLRDATPVPRAPRPPLRSAPAPTPAPSERPSALADDLGAQRPRPPPEGNGSGGQPPNPRAGGPAALGLACVEPRTPASE